MRGERRAGRENVSAMTSRVTLTPSRSASAMSAYVPPPKLTMFTRERSSSISARLSPRSCSMTLQGMRSGRPGSTR